jgi:hypothetical protein
VSSLRLTDEDEDVMVVTLLSSAVLSRSTSVPLVEALDKEALSLAIFPGACPHHTWQAIVMGAKRVLFKPLRNFQPRTRMVL